ncbi:hypothetical protein WG66_011494 [Moniliophthora roreri]|nr:hypothetical protein WG66_011494 [Moniliophthora roreri]
MWMALVAARCVIVSSLAPRGRIPDLDENDSRWNLLSYPPFSIDLETHASISGDKWERTNYISLDARNQMLKSLELRKIVGDLSAIKMPEEIIVVIPGYTPPVNLQLYVMLIAPSGSSFSCDPLKSFIYFQRTTQVNGHIPPPFEFFEPGSLVDMGED